MAAAAAAAAASKDTPDQPTGPPMWPEIGERAVAVDHGDWDAVFRDTHPDFEMMLQRAPDAGTHWQRAAVQRFGEDYLSAFDNMAFEPEKFFENGDQVLVLRTRRARPKGGSAGLVVRNGHLWTLRDGTILSMKSFPDPNEALDIFREKRVTDKTARRHGAA